MPDLFDDLIDNHEAVLEQDDAVLGAALKDLLRRRFVAGDDSRTGLIMFAGLLMVQLATKLNADRIVFAVTPTDFADVRGEWKIAIRHLTRRETARQNGSRGRKRAVEAEEMEEGDADA